MNNVKQFIDFAQNVEKAKTLAEQLNAVVTASLHESKDFELKNISVLNRIHETTLQLQEDLRQFSRYAVDETMKITRDTSKY